MSEKYSDGGAERGIPQQTADRALIRGIGRWALTAFSINITIGAGIFGLPAHVQAIVGNYSAFAIVACGMLMTGIALCFAEIASRFDRSGGPQLYGSIALGPAGGFIVGWLLWLSRLGTCAAVSTLLVDYGTLLWPPLGAVVARTAVICALVGGYTWLNIRGIRQTSLVSVVFTVFKLLPLIAFVAVGLFFIDPRSLHLGAAPSLTNASNAILLAAFAFLGFDAATVLGGEIRDVRRAIPFAILLSMGIVLVLYTLIQIVCAGALPNLATSQRPLADAAVMFIGPAGGTVIALAAIIACAGVFGASMTPGTRLLFAMADQGQIPTALARLHPRFATPVLAILITAAAILLLALSGSFIYLVKVTLIARVTVFALMCLLLPLFRGRRDVPEAQFKVPAGKFVAYGGAIVCMLFLANSSIPELIDVAAAAGTGLVIFGITRITQKRRTA